MTNVSGTTGTSTPTSIFTSTASGVAAGGNDLGDKDTFLKLLVAQLKYQDPSKPADSTQFLAQTAQFTQVEKLDQLVHDQSTMLANQQMLSASNLVGKTITYSDANGADVTGVVAKATFGGSAPTLKVGDTDVPL